MVIQMSAHFWNADTYTRVFTEHIKKCAVHALVRLCLIQLRCILLDKRQLVPATAADAVKKEIMKRQHRVNKQKQEKNVQRKQQKKQKKATQHNQIESQRSITISSHSREFSSPENYRNQRSYFGITDDACNTEIPMHVVCCRCVEFILNEVKNKLEIFVTSTSHRIVQPFRLCIYI